jgi:preprotein translocase subunit YajC
MVFLALYALSVLPRQRAFKEQQKFASNLKPGVHVVTYGGVIGEVKKVLENEGIVKIEIAEGVIVRVTAASIAGEYLQEQVAQDAQRALGKKQKGKG